MITNVQKFLSKRSYLLAISIFILTSLTLFLTLLPVDEILPSKIWSYDKLGHLFIFGSWTFLVGYYRHILKPETFNLFTIFFIGVLFGVGVELLQYVMPFNRTADLFDVAFDALGCFLAILILSKITDKQIL